MVTSWKSGRSFEHHVDSILCEDGVGLTVLRAPEVGEKNLFDVIVEKCPTRESIQFIKWILVGLNAWLDKNQPAAGRFKRWETIRSAPTFRQAVSEFEELWTEIKDTEIMDYETSHALFDGFIMLIAQPRLEILRADMFKNQDLDWGIESHIPIDPEYIEILEMVQKRHVDVDASLKSFHVFLDEAGWHVN